MRWGAIFAVFLSLTSGARADTLTEAIAFAVTGSDGAKVAAVNQAQCIFKVENDTYYFNNIYVDRITFQLRQNRIYGPSIEIELHGKLKVVDEYSAPAKNDGSPIMMEMAQRRPDFFKPHIFPRIDHTLSVSSSEFERVRRAWAYIYANGCTGQKSPF
jgi:hypothetical protein